MPGDRVDESHDTDGDHGRGPGTGPGTGSTGLSLTSVTLSPSLNTEILFLLSDIL